MTSLLPRAKTPLCLGVLFSPSELAFPNSLGALSSAHVYGFACLTSADGFFLRSGFSLRTLRTVLCRDDCLLLVADTMPVHRHLWDNDEFEPV
jgi:hypothetical protein